MSFGWQDAGAIGFGALIGWFVYYINRYRKSEVQLSDIVTLIGAIGGAAVLALFPRGTDLFGAYGVGLAIGFFGYFAVLLVLVHKSTNFNTDWFLDGRRKNPADGWGYGTDVQHPMRPMAVDVPPSIVHNFFGVTPTQALSATARMMPNLMALDAGAQRVIDTSVQVWSASGPNGPFQNACNFFAIEVANRLGVTLSGTADQIVDQIKSGNWTLLADGPAARDAATQGQLVIAGLKGADFTQPRDNGHVAVVVAGAMNPSGWAPAGYWGSIDPPIRALGGSGIPISNCFRAEDSAKIIYACQTI
jgi:hypothetical protein